MGMIEDLNKLGKEIDEAKKSVATLEGRRQEIVERLKADHGIETVDEADALILKLEKDVARLDAEIEKDFTRLKEKFSW